MKQLLETASSSGSDGVGDNSFVAIVATSAIFHISFADTGIRNGWSFLSPGGNR